MSIFNVSGYSHCLLRRACRFLLRRSWNESAEEVAEVPVDF